MHIETPKKVVAKSQATVFEFLSDLKNFEQLMPDSIAKFELLNENRFLFQLKGMPEIVLERKAETPHSQIVLGAASEKLPFTLIADILEIEAAKSEVILSFTGEFNAMMAMMIKNPITNFMGTLSENLDNV
ncbi:SRPBCC family protein [Aggregatimonas sangjinii]|uniref:SRPBCC family protein n=1 Tax=Aggregatimonas sangjinii TaxID=2583587 RepID=A0A5B7SP43_9FLAO|nr:SRPBCC family protein [Aggregatimonas sangjinii]QCW99188.1 SRPBCC family protein [Aggregatimonas sangjinii]